MSRTSTLLTGLAVALAALAGGCTHDKDAPPPPAVDALTSPTNQNPVTLTGTTEAGAAVDVSGGAAAALAIAGADGSFAVDVMLNADADNTLAVTATDEAGNVSAATTVLVTHDGTAPAAPMVDPVASPTPFTTVTVSGTAEAGAAIDIAGAAAPVSATADASGAFSADVDLDVATDPSDNMLEVTATDAAGNVSAAATLTVTFDSTALAPPVVDAMPAFTNLPLLTVTGTAFAGATVSITGGLLGASGPVAANGSFSVDVALALDVVNTLSVTAFTGTQVSAPVFVIVTHDDVAPLAVMLNPVTSPTGADNQDLSGTGEPNATINVAGGASAASTTADAAGNWLVNVALDTSCDPCDTTLTITQTDLALNLGLATMATIHYDSSLPVPISVTPPPSPTNLNPITVTGSAASLGDMVDGSADAVAPVAAAGAGGAFMVSVTLFANATTVLGVHEVGSTVVTFVTVVHDDVAPVQPTVNPVGSPTNMAFVNLTGSTDPNASIAITRSPSGFSDSVMADGSGSWTRIVALETSAAMTSNTFTITATDAAGNVSPSTMIAISYDSTLALSAPVVDPAPAFTQTADVMVTGTVSSSDLSMTTVDISGASTAYTGIAVDPGSGAFAQLVTLSANATNALGFVAHLGSMTSPVAIVTITHDDMAPAAPTGAYITVSDEPSGLACLLGNTASVTGAAASVEGNAEVSVDNLADGAGAVVVTANADGSFNVASISACQGDALQITQADQAGNASTATAIPVP
jgi:hypothetical protein